MSVSRRENQRGLRLALILLCVSSAVIVATEFIVVGLLPFLAQDLGVSLAETGRFVSAFALSAALLGPPLTLVSSSQPPLRVLVTTLMVFAAGNILATVFPGYWMLLSVRVVQGAMLPVFISMGTAAISALAVPDQRARSIALANTGFVIGVVAAVPLGVALADGGMWRLPLLALAVLAVLAAGFVFAFFPRMSGFSASGTSYVLSVRRQAAILLQAHFLAHLLLSVGVFAAMFAAYTYLSAWLQEIVGLDNRGVAAALLGFGSAGLVGNVIVARLAGGSLIRMTVLMVLIVVVAAVGLSVTYEHRLILVLLLALWGAAHTAGVTLCQVRVTLAGGSAAAFAMAMNISAANLGIALGALVGGMVVERAGVNAIGWSAAILLVGVIAGAAAIRATLITRMISSSACLESPHERTEDLRVRSLGRFGGGGKASLPRSRGCKCQG